ncbi:MAG TPA: nucleotidyltransferase family protein [Opitutaceae bacterium]|nr:nucleotidyltransferase family protein [Opitutaceae bacterium]
MDPPNSSVITTPEMLRVPKNFSPELRLLLGLLRVALKTGEAAEIAGLGRGVDWTAFGACVERHRVGPFLHHRLPPEVRSALPVAATQHLRQQSQANVRRALMQSAELARLAKLFEEKNIPVISLKGPLLSRQLYGELGLRHAGDIDLLVAPGNAGPADTVLREAGYRRTEPDFELTLRQAKQYRRLRHEFSYLAAPPRPRMEMTWQLESFSNLENIWPRAIKQELGGQQIHTLPPDININYLFHHGSRHAWFRLFWLVDVALLLAESETDWAGLLGRARAAKNVRPLLQGARLAGELLGAPVPPAFLAGPGEQRKIAAFAAEACHWMVLDADASEKPAGLFRLLIYRLRLQQRWHTKYYILKQRLLFVRGWKMLRLPDWCFALYYPAVPFLYLYYCIAPGRKPSR